MHTSQPEVSDLLFTVDRPLQVESYGELKPVNCDPPIAMLTPFQTELVALNLIGDNISHLENLLRHGSCDAAYALSEKARFRVNIFSQRGHYSIVCRQLNTTIPTLEQLKAPEILKDIPREKTGLVLVTGATGSGKSTTLAAVLHEINKAKPVHIVTLEDPVEYVLAGINQVQVSEQVGLTFATALRAILRQAPNVVMIGEIRDLETASIAINASLTGHLVFSTLHTNDAPGAVARLVDIGVKPFLVASSTRCLMAQRLVRKICKKCTEPSTPTDSEMRALGISPEMLKGATVMKGRGCNNCNNTGNRGRFGIFEIFNIDDEARKLIYDKVSSSVLRARAREMGMRTLREDGIRKILAGMTTPEEVIRSTVGDEA